MLARQHHECGSRATAPAVSAVIVALIGMALLVSCSASPSIPETAATTLLTSPESIAVGSQRLVFQLQDGPTRFGGPDTPATVALDTLGSEATTVPAFWVWGNEEAETGAYVIEADLDRGGTWLATLAVDGVSGTQAVFTVYENSPIPRTGDSAPMSATDTSASFELAELTTDPDPDPRFYERSIDAVVASGDPAVVVFSTPKYCTTTVCGPLLDLVKSRIDDHDDIAFVHVEVYEELDPDEPQLIPRQAVLDWGIQTEPWIFTIDPSGEIAASFEGVLGETELDTALAHLATAN